jgi:hypothetical protein
LFSHKGIQKILPGSLSWENRIMLLSRIFQNYH